VQCNVIKVSVADRKGVSLKLKEDTKDERCRAVLWHQELAFYPSTLVPHALALCCSKLPESGGWTYLTRTDKLMKALGGDLKQRLAGTTHITVKRVASDENSAHAEPGGKTWQDLFGTEDRKYVEGVCESREWGYEWNDETGALQLSIRTPLTRCHPLTGKTCWMNALPAALRLFSEVRTDNGLLEKAVHVPELAQAFVDSEPVEHAWVPENKDDVLIIDNYMAAHAGPVSWTGDRELVQTYGWTTVPPTTPLYP
jgi:hypothetical protein